MSKVDHPYVASVFLLLCWLGGFVGTRSSCQKWPHCVQRQYALDTVMSVGFCNSAPHCGQRYHSGVEDSFVMLVRSELRALCVGCSGDDSGHVEPSPYGRQGAGCMFVV